MNQVKFLSGILFLLIINNLNAQNNFKIGYIIGLENDTIHGYIERNPNLKNRNICSFKKEINQKSQDFTANDIKAYRIENSKFYISKDILINEVETRVFLEYLLKGIVNLYYLAGINYENYYIEKDNKLILLSNEEREVIDENNKKFVVESNQYVGILTYLFQDAPELRNNIQSTGFTYKSLIKITEDYHNSVCNAYECINYTRSTKAKIYIEPHVGGAYSTMGLKTSANTATDIAPYSGLNLRLQSEKIYFLWNFLIGINFSQNNYNGDFENDIVVPGRTHELTVKYTTVRIPITIERRFLTKNIQPFLSLALQNTLLLNPDYKVEYHSTNQDFSSLIDSDFRNYQLGIAVGCGVRFKLPNSNYLYFKANYEYRAPLVTNDHFLDFQHINSILTEIGYGIKL